MSQKFARRSLLYIPGSSLKMLGKAKSVAADSVILDLEDSVSVDEKSAARENIAKLLLDLRDSGKERIVRVNAADTIWCYQDIMAIAGQDLDAIVVPKAKEESLIAVDMLLAAMEQELGLEPYAIKMIPLFETAYAIANAYQVLGVSARIDGVQLGAEDLTKEQGIVRTSGGKEILYARQQLAMAARARNIDILDTPYTDIKDMDGLLADAELVKSIGFTGKTCIHPGHIETINRVFSPTEQEVAYSRGIVEAYQASVKARKGACVYLNKMIDKPVAERAQKVLKRATQLGIY